MNLLVKGERKMIVKTSIQEAKEFLVKYINENRKVSFPNLTL